jgi:hypothetical protein
MQESEDPEVIKAKLNMETARIPWSQLQRFFAAGRTRLVTEQGDLVDVALQFALDNSEQIAEWIENGIITDVDDATALDWVERDAEVWAVVAAPWILVQADKSENGEA